MDTLLDWFGSLSNFWKAGLSALVLAAATLSWRAGKRSIEFRMLRWVLPMHKHWLLFWERIELRNWFRDTPVFISRSFVLFPDKLRLDFAISKRYYNHLPEVVAILDLTKKLAPYGVEIFHQRVAESTQGHQNIIVVGGTFFTEPLTKDQAKNELKKRFGVTIEKAASSDRCEKFFCRYGDYNYVLECEHNEDFSVKRDPAMIYRYRYNEIELLVCSGMHAFGSAAALQLAFMEEFQKKVKKHRAQEFIQFLSVEVTNGLYVDANDIDWDTKYPFIVTKRKPRLWEWLGVLVGLGHPGIPRPASPTTSVGRSS